MVFNSKKIHKVIIKNKQKLGNRYQISHQNLIFVNFSFAIIDGLKFGFAETDNFIDFQMTFRITKHEIHVLCIIGVL